MDTYSEYDEPCEICGDICEDCFEYGCCGVIEGHIDEYGNPIDRRIKDDDELDMEAAFAYSIVNSF